MTFEEYVNNPTGAKTAVMSYRKMYEDLYHNKWDKIMVRENGKVDYTLYKSPKAYFAHIKIPSETVENFYYDVVIKLVPASKLDRNLDHATAQFFSNDPSFNYTFAHAFVKHKMYITELEKKMSKLAVQQRAKEKNPQDTIGYVKTLYFAYIVMRDKGLFHLVRFESEAKPFNEKILLSNIKDTEECIEERVKAGSIKKAKDKANEENNRVRKSDSIINPEVKNKGFINKIIPKAPISGSSKSHIIKPIKKRR